MRAEISVCTISEAICFEILKQFLMLSLGGVHSTWGPVVGAVVLGVVSEFLKLQIPYGHLLVYGVIIVITILFFPQGIVGTLGQRLKKSDIS